MKLLIDGRNINAARGSSILEAAAENGIHIPSLCHLKDLNCISVCRVCLVEVKGSLLPACSTAAEEGMEILTDSPRLRDARRRNLELICSDHNMDCSDCPRGADCELRSLCKEYGVDDRAFGMGKRSSMVDDSTPYLVRDNSKCILCRRCEAVCVKLQGVGAISANGKGDRTNVGFGLPLSETDCVGCGQCVAACPTGALTQKDNTKRAWKAIFDREKYVAAALSPSAYKRIGELFGEAPGSDCGRKLAEMLRKIGFDRVYDLAGAEEWAKQSMLAKATPGSISANCPAWRRHVEKKHPELMDKLIAPESLLPHIAADCAAAAEGREVCIVRISNCIACKGGGGAAVELSTREAFEMIRRACVSSFTADRVWAELRGEDFDAFPDLPETEVPELELLEAGGLVQAEKALKGQAGAVLLARACPEGCMYGGGMPMKKQ